MLRYLKYGWFALFAAYIIPLCTFAATQDSAHSGFSLVLSGGGARGLAQIGVLKAFDEAHIKPALIVGNSMGALVGALYAAGLSADSIASIAKQVSWNDFYLNAANRNQLFVSRKNEASSSLFEVVFDKNFVPVLPKAISNGQSFFDLLAPLMAPPMYQAHDDFDRLKTPLRIVTTDIVTGKKVVFKSGNIAYALRASCGVPFMFAPVPYGEMLLVDGGFAENLPVATAQEISHRPVVAVNASSPLWKKDDLVNPLMFADQLFGIALHPRTDQMRTDADILIEPDLAGFRNTDFTMTDSIIERGYQAGRAAIDRIREVCGIEIVPPDSTARPVPRLSIAGVTVLEQRLFDSLYSAYAQSHTDISPLACVDSIGSSWALASGNAFRRVTTCQHYGDSLAITIQAGKVRSIQVTGNTKTNSRVILNAIPVNIGDTLSRDLIAAVIRVLYATDLFETVNVSVDAMDILHIFLKEKLYLGCRGVLRYDEFHLLEGYIKPYYDNLLGMGLNTSLHLQYGLKREKYAAELSANHALFGMVNGFAKANAYVSREHIREVIEPTVSDTEISSHFFLQEQTLRKVGVLGVTGFELGTVSQLEVGIRLEQFKVHQSDRNIFSDPLSSFKNGIRYLFVRLTIDDLDRFPLPSRGRRYSMVLGGAHDALGGTESFLKTSGTFLRFIPLGLRHTISLRSVVAWANRQLPDVERVFMGGLIPFEKYQDLAVYNYVSFMGLQPRALPGDDVLLGEIAYRYSFAKNLDLTTTLDWGQVWDFQDFSFSRSSLDDIIKAGPIGLGLSIAYGSPIGPIRGGWGRIIGNTRALSAKGISDNNVFYLSVGYDF